MRADPRSRASRAVAGLLLLAACLAGPAAWGQEGDGTIIGQVLDADTGLPVAGVTVTAIGPAPAEGGAAPEQSAATNEEGVFTFPSVPAGRYDLRFARSGYRESRMTDFAVQPGQLNRADFPLPPLPADTAGPLPEIEEFVVIASPAAEILAASRMDADELVNTLSAEELSKFAASDVADALKFVPGVNVQEGQFAIIRGLEDRYSSTLYNGAPVPSPDPDRQSVQLDLFPSDVVSDLVVAKTFAPDLPGNSSGGSINIITHGYPEVFELKLSYGTGWETYADDRFLEYIGGVPIIGGSPVGKDSNDIAESEYGGSIGGRYELLGREIRFKGVYNQEIDYRTKDGKQESREPVRAYCNFGVNCPDPITPADNVTTSGDLAFGRLSLSEGLYDYTESQRSEQDTWYAGFGFDLDRDGSHRIDASYFDTTKDEEIVTVKENGYFPEYDYNLIITQQENDFTVMPFEQFQFFAVPGTWMAFSQRDDPTSGPTRGPFYFDNFQEDESYFRHRELTVKQINGDHSFLGGGHPLLAWLEGLRVSWAVNQAETTQSELALAARVFFEPDDPLAVMPRNLTFPVTVDQLGEGKYYSGSGILRSSNEISEDQDFWRLDVAYETEVSEWMTVELSSNAWFEKAKREVAATFLINPDTPAPGSNFAVPLGGAETLVELGETLFGDFTTREDGLPNVIRESFNDSEREIWAWGIGSKLTFLEQLDVLAGFRLENIFIESNNDPIVEGELKFGGPNTFPEVYFLFDRLDNPFRPGDGPPLGSPTDVIYNDQILGIDVPIGPCREVLPDGTILPPPNPDLQCVDLLTVDEVNALVNGTIDERKILPAVGFTLRVLEGLTLRGAWSKTVARPSFREMGFYMTTDPGSSDQVIGNPQLQLSDVESYDLRLEYTGSDGDLAAVSTFYKLVDDPIEAIFVRNPVVFDSDPTALARTFYNNPAQATLWGIEVEARKNLGFLDFSWAGLDLPYLEFFQYFSVGGNYTYIDAEVDRSVFEVARANRYFAPRADEADQASYDALEPTRRLFNQPEWIANFDVGFDHPDWGSKVTLVFFAISSVLDTAGSATLGPDNRARSFTLDRYAESYHQLDLVMSQSLEMPERIGRWELPYLGKWTFRTSIKNLTDSKRGVFYDEDQLDDKIRERSYRQGLDYSFSISYTLSY